MINRFITVNALTLPLCLLFTIQSAWSLGGTGEKKSAPLSSLNIAIAFKKSGNINQAIKALHKHLQEEPQDIHGQVELAANYFLAKSFSKGARLFKRILKNPHASSKIKTNITHFINQHKDDIKKYAYLNKTLATIKLNSHITADKIDHTKALLIKAPAFKKAQLYLVSLYLKQYRGSEAKQLLEGILFSRLTLEEERTYFKLNRYYHQHYYPSSSVSIKGSFILGHDSNITAGGDSDLPGELGLQESEFEEEFEEEFNDTFEEEFIESFEEEFEEEFNEAFEEDYEESYEEAYEQAYDEAFNQDCEDESTCDDEENSPEDKSGAYSRLNARIQMSYKTPVINDGLLTHSVNSAIFANVTEREYQDGEAQHRNYRVLELGASIARRNNYNTRLALPISIKTIQLNGENYARFYEGSLSYGFNINKNRISLSEKISYRDYQHYNKERENALLVKTSVSISRTLNSSFTATGKMVFSLLETDNTPHTSYDRFKASLGVTYQATNTLSFGVGNEYQVTNYNDHFNPGDDCIDNGLCYEVNREDRYSNYYLDSQIKLNKNWSIKGRLSKSNRKTNHEKHKYKRTTFSAGIYMKF